MKVINYVMLFIFFLVIFSSGISASTQIKISDKVEITKLSEGCYIHVSYSAADHGYPNCPANGLIYISEDGVYIVDTPWNNKQTAELIDWVKKKNLKKRIVAFVITHWHDDCMGGLEEVNRRKIDSYALELTDKILKEKKLPLTSHTFQNSLILGTGKKILNLNFPGKGHTVDNIVVWCPADRILYAGCIVKAISWKSLGYTADGDLKAWPVSLKGMLKQYVSAKIVIPGHGKHGNLDIIKHTLNLFENKK